MTKRKHIWLLLAVVATLALTGVPSQAANVTVYNSEAAFDADAPGLTVEDFEDANLNTVFGCPSPLDSTSNNACVSPGDIAAGLRLRNDPLPHRPDGIALFGPAAGFGGASNIAFISNYFVDELVIEFNPPVQAVGLSVYKWLSAGTCRTTATLADGDTELVTHACSPTSSFLGFISDSPITSIKMDSGNDAFPDAQGVYAVKFGQLPSSCSQNGLAGQTLAEQVTGTDLNESGAVSGELHNNVEPAAGPAGVAVHEAACLAAAAGA